MATHSSILALRSPWTEEPGRLQSIGLHRVRHDSSNLARNPIICNCFLASLANRFLYFSHNEGLDGATSLRCVPWSTSFSKVP